MEYPCEDWVNVGKDALNDSAVEQFVIVLMRGEVILDLSPTGTSAPSVK